MFETKRRALLFMTISIGMAVAAILLFSTYISNTQASLGEMVTVHVADGNIEAGKPIPDNLIATKEIPKKFMLPSLIQSKDELKGKISMVPIPKGEVLTTTVLRDDTILSDKYRQVILRAPIAVFDDATISALDKVDLIVTYESEDAPKAEEQPHSSGPSDKRITKVLFKDITVNTVGLKNNNEIVNMGVVLTLEQSKSAIWGLNYAKEIRVLKSGSQKATKEGGAEKK
ncbi:Flp pilus assembly protein CpaB [Paenibacillus lutrae]|uniref:SAF domain-containing protein n=1 Tax=Paenibacillus lutrae TaxID=2078573 RepID=A0A7X3FKX8_9BACL|nr:SAF domain-containing protein [Paenibacillus lutrae]MVP01603.1 hypothetical protein [Paenibacillus lutrae]